MVGSSLTVSGAAPAGAIASGITVHCPADNLQFAIYNAEPGSTIVVDGTCTGNFYIDKDLTLTGPAVLDGGGTGPGLYVAAGTVVLNDLTIQNGTGIFGTGGGLWNGGQLTLNRSTVTNNHANGFGGVFNFGQLKLNRSTVSHNTSNGNAGGIFNCAASLHEFGLCTGAPGSLTLNGSTVSDNAARFEGGGIWNDAQANLTINNGSTVSGNTAGGEGGGISNDGTATISSSTVSNNHTTGTFFGSEGGGIANTGPTTLSNAVVRGNRAAFIGGGIYAAGPMTINNGTVSDNYAAFVGGGMVVWDGPTTVNNSVFSNNSDGGFFPDDPAGVWVAPRNFGGFFVNNPSFTTHNSSYSSPPASADLSVTKSDSPDPVTAGTDLTYTITVANAGPNAAQNVAVTDGVPNGTTFVSFTQDTGPAFGCFTPPVGEVGPVSCIATSALPSGASATFTLVVHVNAAWPTGAIIANTVFANTSSSDPNPGNNRADESTTVG